MNKLNTITQQEVLVTLNLCIKRYKMLLHEELKKGASKRLDEIASKLDNLLQARDLIAK